MAASRITVIDANSFDLVGSTFTGAYVNTGWASVSRNLAPASNTDVKVQFVTIADYAELTTEITAGRGQSVAGQGLGVNVLSTIAPRHAGRRPGAQHQRRLPVLAATGYSANPVGGDHGARRRSAGDADRRAGHQALRHSGGGLAVRRAAGGIINTTDVVLRAAAGGRHPQLPDRDRQVQQRARHGGDRGGDQGRRDGDLALQLCRRRWRHPIEITFPTPLRGTAATAMNVACLTTGAQVFVNAQGFAAP